MALRGRAAFARLDASRIRARSGPIGLRMSVAHGQQTVAVGYAVSRRQGGAVLRNRMRRRLRSIVAEMGGTWPGGDYLITLKAPAATMAHEELRDHLKQAVIRLQR